MLEGLFDIKNDRRLGMYLYRMGFGMWLLYLVLGAPAMRTYLHYRTDCGVLSFALMVISFSIAMVYDYFHNPVAYETKKKWLFISYVVLAGVIYFLEFKGSNNFLDLKWLLNFM
ncbi:hypothetical protein DYBT9275_00772 [Dyadobacter sp. CECT 9275]|uniref:Uncharacterized protein n=1 Tax=Dyadobacter helix TaxID=2822344 RepID=A0A916NJW5_9BACT|nr:hypothetical protein [Dyadobacter sp. CECT 9275]CAG4991527.1 hypothetical protein DYBT9275_00772 [Dyadobacter sp. CECT 9275]